MSELLEQDVNQYMITLLDEEGKEVIFEVLDMVEYQDETYAVLLPEGSEYDVVILKVTAIDETQEQFEAVENEDVVLAVFELFKERCKAEFDFE